MKRLEQRQAAQVPEEDPSSGCKSINRTLQDTHQVVDAGEVLGHGVDHDGVERLALDALEIVRRPAFDHDVSEFLPRAGQRFQLGDDLLRKIGADIHVTPWCDAAQQESASAADLQHPAGPQGT